MLRPIFLFSAFFFLALSASSADFSRDERGRTALHITAKAGKIEINLRELSKTRIIDAQDNEGFTALHYAVLNLRTKAIKILLKAGASKSIKNNLGKSAEDILDDLPTSIKQKKQKKVDKIYLYFMKY